MTYDHSYSAGCQRDLVQKWLGLPAVDSDDEIGDDDLPALITVSRFFFA